MDSTKDKLDLQNVELFITNSKTHGVVLSWAENETIECPREKPLFPFGTGFKFYIFDHPYLDGQFVPLMKGEDLLQVCLRIVGQAKREGRDEGVSSEELLKTAAKDWASVKFPLPNGHPLKFYFTNRGNFNLICNCNRQTGLHSACTVSHALNNKQ